MTLNSSSEERTGPQMSMNVVRIEETRTELDQLISQLNNNASSVKEVNLRRRTLSDEDMSELCQALETNTHVIGMSLLSNDITNTQAIIIANMLLKNTSIRWLSLARNHLSDNGIIQLFQSMKTNATVQVLNLSYQTTVSESEETGGEEGSSSSSSNENGDGEEKEEVVHGITDEAMRVLTKVLKFHNRTLTGINLRGHMGITTDSVKELISALSTYNAIADVYIDNDNDKVSPPSRVALNTLLSDDQKESRTAQVNQFQQQLEVQKALQDEKEQREGEGSGSSKKVALLVNYDGKKVRMDASGMDTVEEVLSGIKAKLALRDQDITVTYFDTEFEEEVELDQDGLQALIDLGKGKLSVELK